VKAWTRPLTAAWLTFAAALLAAPASHGQVRVAATSLRHSGQVARCVWAVFLMLGEI
jgi:hypothetical protein